MSFLESPHSPYLNANEVISSSYSYPYPSSPSTLPSMSDLSRSPVFEDYYPPQILYAPRLRTIELPDHYHEDKTFEKICSNDHELSEVGSLGLDLALQLQTQIVENEAPTVHHQPQPNALHIELHHKHDKTKYRHKQQIGLTFVNVTPPSSPKGTHASLPSSLQSKARHYTSYFYPYAPEVSSY